MIDGLKLTMTGAELQVRLDERIRHHEERADNWAREQTRTAGEATDEAALLPEHICANESERHAWRADVLRFVRDHLAAAETYRLGLADLEAGELLPARPGWLEQDDYEERTGLAFNVERLAKSVDALASAIPRALSHLDMAPRPQAPRDSVEETAEFRITRLDLEDGPEVVMFERKEPAAGRQPETAAPGGERGARAE